MSHSTPSSGTSSESFMTQQYDMTDGRPASACERLPCKDKNVRIFFELLIMHLLIAVTPLPTKLMGFP